MAKKAKRGNGTGNVYGRFYGYEGTMPATDSLRRYFRRYRFSLDKVLALLYYSISCLNTGVEGGCHEPQQTLQRHHLRAILPDW
jgi:hypothetical protein